MTGTGDDAAALCRAMSRLEASGLNHGRAGNVSMRSAAGFLITPSGSKPEQLEAAAIVAMDRDGTPLQARARPSSEWRFHRDIYLARAEVNAIVHVHSAYATALACQRRGLPAFHYMVAVAGGVDIRCAPYATFGSQALSDAALAALSGRKACLLANHGQIALGPHLGAALDLAVEVEQLARQYMLSRMDGEPVLLGNAEMGEVIEKFKTYGAGHG